MKLVIIVFGVALPLSVYGMRLWVEGYAHHVPITWDVFALTGAMTLRVTFLTIGYQAMRAALANSAQSLRSRRKRRFIA